MKLKALIMAFALLGLGALATSAHADDLSVTRPTFDLGIARSDYAVANSTLAISSSVVTTIQPAGSYNTIVITNLNFGTTFFYRADGSSVAVPTVGIPIFPNTKERIETNNPVNVQLAPTISNKDARIQQIAK